MHKIAVVVTEDWVFVSHRLSLFIASLEKGFSPVIITRCRNHRSKIETSGLRTINFEMNRRGLTPWGILAEVVKLSLIYRCEKPDLVHHVGLRPVVVGSLAAKLAGQKRVVAALTGMGFLFISKRSQSFITKTLKKFLPWLLNKSTVVVQNIDDMQALIQLGINKAQIHLIRGAGVNTNEFRPAPAQVGPPVVMLHARMLWDKGVKEFVQAASFLKKNGYKARFVLVGEPDPNNPATVPSRIFSEWKMGSTVECWGYRTNINKVLSQASIVCLPSYREGLPKSLLEAISCGLPCVTTDTSGCNEVVRNGDNGLLVPVGDVIALAKAIQKLLDDPLERKRMGINGRSRALREFDEKLIIKQTLDLYTKVLKAA